MCSIDGPIIFPLLCLVMCHVMHPVTNHAAQLSSVPSVNGKMRACSLGLVGLGFRVRDKVSISVRDGVGVRISSAVVLGLGVSIKANRTTEHDRTVRTSTEHANYDRRALIICL